MFSTLNKMLPSIRLFCTIVYTSRTQHCEMGERYVSCLRSEVAWSLLKDYPSKLAIEERSHWQLVLLRKFIKKKRS